MKKCQKYGIPKELTDFIKHQAYKDGHTQICKECTNKKWKETQAAKASKPEPWFIFD